MDILKAFSLIDETHNINIQGTVENPLFQANQIGKLLGINNISQAIKDFEEDERSLILNETLGGKQETNFLTESGLYRLLARSRKPIAAIFQKWMINTIKEIRVNGMYKLKQENEVDKKLMEIKGELQQHRIYLDAYDNKYVVYVCKLRNVDDKILIKIGKSEELVKRMRQILSTYNDVTPVLLNVFETSDFSKFETHIHGDNFIKKYRFNEQSKNGKGSREIYLVNKEEYNEMIKIIKIIKPQYDNNDLKMLEKQIEAGQVESERLKIQIEADNSGNERIKNLKELAEVELKKREIELEIVKIEENIKNQEEEKEEHVEEEEEEHEISKEEPQLFTIRKRNHSSRIPKIYQYNPDNLTTPIKMYNGPSDVERQNATFSPTPLKLSSRNNTIYKGYRWLYVNRNEEPPQELEPTKETKNISPEVQFIAMIDIKKTKILAVYSNQKQAVEARNMKCNSFTRAIQQQSLSSGHYWNFFDKCSEEMQTEYLSHSKLPEKYVPACSKKVQQIDPKTNEIIKTYNSNREVCNVAQISTAVIRRITETGEIYNGYKWKLVCL
jgi:prophage antirepressor-like protein